MAKVIAYIHHSNEDPERFTVLNYNSTQWNDYTLIEARELEFTPPPRAKLISDAIKGLEAQIARRNTECFEDTKRLKEKIESLLAIEHHPSRDFDGIPVDDISF